MANSIFFGINSTYLSGIEKLVTRIIDEKTALKIKNIELQSELFNISRKFEEAQRLEDLETMYQYYLTDEIHKVLSEEI